MDYLKVIRKACKDLLKISNKYHPAGASEGFFLMCFLNPYFDRVYLLGNDYLLQEAHANFLISK